MLPMLQGPSILSKDCSNFLASHLPLFEHSLSFFQQHSLLRECINYHDRVIEVSSSFTRTPQGFLYTNTYPHSYAVIRLKFLLFMLSFWQQTLYDGRVEVQRKAGTLKNCIFAKGNLFRSDTSHSLASHMEKFERHIIHLGSMHHGIAQARLLCIVPNMSLSHVPSNQSTTWSFFTRILHTPSSC